MAGRLHDQHILVTGGSRGIGAAIIEKALAEDARVSFIDIEQQTGEALLASLAAKGRCHFGAGSVTSAAEPTRSALNA